MSMKLVAGQILSKKGVGSGGTQPCSLWKSLVGNKG